MDGARVREISFEFRKRTSCAGDQIVIEMLTELDADIWETIASCLQFRLINHWTEETEELWKALQITIVKKKNGKLTMRRFRPFAMLPTIYRLHSKTLQQVAGQTLQARQGPRYGHVPWSAGARSCEDASKGGGTGNRMVDSSIRDGLRCGCCI